MSGVHDDLATLRHRCPHYLGERCDCPNREEALSRVEAELARLERERDEAIRGGGVTVHIWKTILRGILPGQYSDRAIRERREASKRCICPSHASNRGECPVHDEKGRVRA